MEEFKGTQGKWSYVADGINNIAIIDESECDICCIEAMNDDYLLSEVEWSNAMIISAAPELLEMLSHFVRCYKRDGYLTNSDLEDAEELINKALGNGKET